MLIGGQTVINKDDYDDDEEDAEENLFSSKVWVYDWNVMRWKKTKRLSEGRHSHSCAKTVDEKLVVVAGGVTDASGNEGSLTVEVFDIATEEWKVLTSSRLPWSVIGVPFVYLNDIPTLFKSNDLLLSDDVEDSERMKSSKYVKIVQMENGGSFTKHNYSNRFSAQIRPHGVILIVPELLVCF